MHIISDEQTKQVNNKKNANKKIKKETTCTFAVSSAIFEIVQSYVEANTRLNNLWKCHSWNNQMLSPLHIWQKEENLMTSCYIISLDCQSILEYLYHLGFVEKYRSFRWKCLTTVFVDTRLWKTKHSRKRFQNFRQSYVFSTCRIEIHQSQPLVWPSTSC